MQRYFKIKAFAKKIFISKYNFKSIKLPIKFQYIYFGMKKSRYHIIGVMSGTSLDGIDLTQLEFNRVDEAWKFKIKNAETIPYSDYWRNELQQAISYSKEKLERLDFKYTEKLAEEISRFIRRNGIQTLDAVCSHGHTVLHQPEKGWTYQIGNLPRLAKLIERTVVCDFRVADVKLGGEGAPLVPVGDRLLFSEYDFCLNLGGFANISFEKDTEQKERIAYDICPVNIVLNHYARKLGKDFDVSGNFARSGKVNLEVLEKLNLLDFYSENPPKSLGLEWVREYFFPILETANLSAEDVLATCTRHMAIQLSKNISENSTVLITGGGAYNDFLIESLNRFSGADIKIPDGQLVEYKEALIFGLLGVLRLRNEINCLSSVTGAKKDHSSGKVYYP